jgi:hypothetical protein
MFLLFYKRVKAAPHCLMEWLCKCWKFVAKCDCGFIICVCHLV